MNAADSEGFRKFKSWSDIQGEGGYSPPLS